MKAKELEEVINEFLYNGYFDDFRIVFQPDRRAEDSLRSKISNLKIKLEEARLLGENFEPLLDEAEDDFYLYVEANADDKKKPIREKLINKFSLKFKTFRSALISG